MDQTSCSGLRFVKMHGAGNDFVIFDSRGRTPVTTPALARAVGDRHRGVGFDQLAEVTSGQDADIALDFWNNDGSRAGACGNATRCVADMVMAEQNEATLSIRTPSGLLHAIRHGDGAVWVNMGLPQLTWEQIPLSHAVDTLHLPLPGDPVAVGMGNPHCVFFIEDAETPDLQSIGPKLENHPLFPQRANVEFASLTATDTLRMRVWERGAGVTLACGSGACATAVGAHLRGLTGKRVALVMDGGTLQVDWQRDGVWLTGPVAHVFDGVIAANLLDPKA